MYVATGLVVSTTALAQIMARHLSAITWNNIDQDAWPIWCQSDPRKTTSVKHWNENVIILMKVSSLAAPKVVILTTFGAASDEDFIKMKTFSFQWIWMKIHQFSFKETWNYGLQNNCCFFFQLQWGLLPSRFAPSQWETALLCNDVSHWLGASLESALLAYLYFIPLMKMYYAISSKCQWNGLVHLSIGTWTSIVH